MQMQLYPIAPVLQPYVKVICAMEIANEEDGRAPFRVLPDTCIELFINYSDTSLANIAGNKNFKSGHSFIVSRMSSYMDVHMQPGSGCIAICFNPGTAYQFFPLPMNAITDSVVGTEHLWENATTDLEERVANAHSNEERVAIIQQYLIQQLVKKQQPDKAIAHCLWQINLYKGQLSLNQLSDETGISLRQLGRRFNNCVGLSPKEYTRINRFLHSLVHLKKYPAISLTEVAYESGYYDQAHFIHDCKSYSGYSPGELLVTPDILC